VIPLAGRNVRLHVLLQFGLACANQVKKSGGNAKCFSLPDFVVVEMSRVSRNEVESLVNCLGESPFIRETTLNLMIEERATPEREIESPEILPGECAHGRLTKKFLEGLPNGAIIVGNEQRNGMPNFYCRLGDGRDRTRLWRRALNAGANQRTCHVYWNPRDVLVIHGVDPDVDLDNGDSLHPT
jgi:hypothetical protein